MAYLRFRHHVYGLIFEGLTTLIIAVYIQGIFVIAEPEKGTGGRGGGVGMCYVTPLPERGEKQNRTGRKQPTESTHV